MTESNPPDNLNFGIRVLRRFRNVNHYRHFQGRPATRALLAIRHTGSFPLQIDLRGYRVSAHRTVPLPLSVILL